MADQYYKLRPFLTLPVTSVRIVPLSEEEFLRNHPQLRSFCLSMLTTGIAIGAGAYGSVEVVMSGVICAAKKIHDLFFDKLKTPWVNVLTSSS